MMLSDKGFFDLVRIDAMPADMRPIDIVPREFRYPHGIYIVYIHIGRMSIFAMIHIRATFTFVPASIIPGGLAFGGKLPWVHLPIAP
jgi:hypothetical protein